MNSTLFAAKVGFLKAKGTAPAAGDLYGGSNSPTFGAGTQALITDPKIETAPEMLDDESVNGSQFVTGSDVAMLPVKISGSHDIRTIGSGPILFSALGYDSLQGPVSTSGKYAHLLLVDPMGKDQVFYDAAEKVQVPTIGAGDYKNRYFHFLQRYGMGNIIARNATIKEFTLSAESKAALKLEFSGSAQDHEIDADYSQSTGMTLPFTLGAAKRFRFSDLVATGCYIGVWNAGGTAITEAKECLLNFSIKQNFGQAEGMATSCSGLRQAEPVADGFNDASIELSRYKVDTFDWLDRLTNGTEICFRATFAIGSYQVSVFVPRIKITNAAHELGEGGKINITGKILIADSSVDPFAAQRTVGGTLMTLPFNTGMYMLVVDDEDANYMRTV